MRIDAKILLKNLLVLSLSASLVAGCSSVKKHEKAAQQQAQQEGLNTVEKASFDGTFIAPGTNFSGYNKILITPLDLENVDIRQPSARGATPWTLSADDKRFFQAQYTEALIENLVADGRYATAIDVGQDVFIIKSRIVQIAPTASKDDIKSRPTISKVYTEGAGNMIIEISLFDSVTNKLIAIITDERELGRFWEENNRATTSRQISIAFDGWLRKLRNELDELAEK